MDRPNNNNARALGNLRPAAALAVAVGLGSGPQAAPAPAFDSHASDLAGIPVLGTNPDRYAGEILVNSSAAATSAPGQGFAANTRLTRSQSASGDALTAVRPLRIGSSITAARVTASIPALRRANSATGTSALLPGMRVVDNLMFEGQRVVARQQHTVMPTLAQGASGHMLQGHGASSSGASVPAPPVPAGTGGQDPPQRFSARLAAAKQHANNGAATRSHSTPAAIGGPQSAMVGTAAPTQVSPAVSSAPTTATLSSPYMAAHLPQEGTPPMAPGQPALHGAVSPMRNTAPAQPATQAADASGDQQASAAPGSATHSQPHEAADSEYGSPLGDFSSPGAAYDRLEPGLHAPDMHARLAAVAGCSSQPTVTADGAIAATPPAPPPSSLRDGSINQAAAILAPRLHTHGPSQARGGSTSQTAASTGQPSAGPQEAPNPTRLRAVGGATGHAAAGDSAQQAAILAAPTPPPSSLRDGSSSRAAASTAQPPLVNRAPTPDPLQVRGSAGSQTDRCRLCAAVG